MTFTLNITRDQVLDLLDTASRGSAYWCNNDLAYESQAKKAMTREGIEVIDTEDDDKIYTLNIKSIKNGLQKMAEIEPKHLADLINGDGDQVTGDIFLQYCLFGNIIYQ